MLRIAPIWALCCVIVGGVCPATSAQDEPIEFHALTAPVDPDEFQALLPTEYKEIYNLLERLLVIRLKQTLDADIPQMVALHECAGEAKEQLTMLKWLRAGARDHLRWQLEQETSPEEIAAELDLLLDYEEQIASVLADMVHSSRVALNAADSARLYLFVDDFEQFVSETIATIVDDPESSVHPAPPDVTPESADSFSDMVREDNRDVPLDQFAGEDVIELVDALLMVRLAETLNLDSTEMVQLSKRVGTHKDRLHELKWQIGGNRQALREAIASGAPAHELNERVNDLLLQEQAVANLVREFVEGAREDVTEHQAAKLYLFLGDFEDYIVDLLQRAGGATP